MQDMDMLPKSWAIILFTVYIVWSRMQPITATLFYKSHPLNTNLGAYLHGGVLSTLFLVVSMVFFYFGQQKE